PGRRPRYGRDWRRRAWGRPQGGQRPCCSRGGRRDHDGLWRCLPGVSGETLRGLGRRRSRRPRPRRGTGDPGGDRRPGAGARRRASVMGNALGRRCLAEAIATFSLVFAGCGAIVVDHERGGSLGTIGIAAAFGLSIMVMVYATGHVSGAHINPAVTVAFSLTRHFPARHAALYIPAQLAGAVGGALVLRL